MQFFTILQGKLHLLNIQDDRSTRFLGTTNYRIDLILNRFRGDNSIMPRLFSHKNLILCGVQGKMGFQQKRQKNFQNHLYGQPVLTFDKRQICRASCFYKPQHNKEFIMLIFYLMVFYAQSLKAFDTRGILSTQASDVHVRLKTTNKAMLKNCKRN